MQGTEEPCRKAGGCGKAPPPAALLPSFLALVIPSLGAQPHPKGTGRAEVPENKVRRAGGEGGWGGQGKEGRGTGTEGTTQLKRDKEGQRRPGQFWEVAVRMTWTQWRCTGVQQGQLPGPHVGGRRTWAILPALKASLLQVTGRGPGNQPLLGQGLGRTP